METGFDSLEDEGGWYLLKYGKPVLIKKLKMNESGIKSVGSSSIALARKEWIGVHKKDNTLNFIAYTLQPSRCCRNMKLKKEEVTIVAMGKKTKEENLELATKWYDAAQRLLGRGSPDSKKPFLVLINPMSGPKISVKMWETIGNKVIHEEGGHQVYVIKTERANHALEFVRDHPDIVREYKGIIIVSGDGLIYEVLQGIMKRKDWANCLRNLPIGVLPAGSGNGLARSIAADAGLPHTPLTASVLISRGNSRALDVCAVDIARPSGPPIRTYSFLCFEWALVADIDIGSEYLRCLGETRFTIEGVFRWIKQYKYGGRLSYLPVVDKSQPQPRSALDPSVPNLPTYWETHDDTSHEPITGLVPPLDQPVPNNWVVIEDTFWNVWNCNVAWMSGSANIAPDAKFDDGYIQLQFMRENGPISLNKFKLLKYLLGLDEGAHQNMKFVEMMPSRAFRFEPRPNPDGKTEGIIAIDGEVVDYAPMQMENLRSFMRIFCAESSSTNSSKN